MYLPDLEQVKLLSADYHRVPVSKSIPPETKTPIEENKSPRLPGLPPFSGGLVGYFSYDYIKYSEGGLNLDAEDQEGFKDVDLMLFDKVIAYDHLEGRIILIANVRTDAVEENYRRAVTELDHLHRLIGEGLPAGTLSGAPKIRACPNLSGEPATIPWLRRPPQFRSPSSSAPPPKTGRLWLSGTGSTPCMGCSFTPNRS